MVDPTKSVVFVGVKVADHEMMVLVAGARSGCPSRRGRKCR